MRRREFLAAIAAAPAVYAAPAPDRYAKQVKITGVEVFQVPVQERYGWTIVRLQTDAGLTGLGDASESGRGDSAVANIHRYTEMLKGRTIYEVEWFRSQVYPEQADGGRAVSAAFSGIEQAMYDLQGQAQNLPMHALFGGKLRDEIRNYANINRASKTRTPEGFRPVLEKAIAAGFDSMKMAPFDRKPKNASEAELTAHFDRGIRSIQMAREMMGDGDVLVEGHSNFDLERALGILPRMEPLRPYWFEEAIRHLPDMAKLRGATEIPIAGGEGLFGIERALHYIQLGAVDILMPDIKWCAGCLELKKISAICEAVGVSIAPHGPMSSIGNMTAAQVCSTIPNFSILEYSYGDAPWKTEFTDPPEPLGKGGMLRVPDTPGLGYKLNMKTVNARGATKTAS